MTNLRPYQQEAVDSILSKLDEHQSTLLVLATGLGKTHCFTHLTKHFKNLGRIMVIAHREELIHQAAGHAKRITGDVPDIEMASEWATSHDIFKADIVISTVQTQNSGMNGDGRMSRFDPKEFSLLVIDECLPAGTLVDGIPIEERQAGQSISSYNHKTNQVETKPITRAFRRKTDSIAEISLSNGKNLICTSNHPIFTLTGYKPAGTLTANDMVLCVIQSKGTYYGISKDLSHLPQKIYNQQQATETLFCGGVPSETKFHHYGSDQSQIRFGANAKKESHVAARSASESIDPIAVDGLGADQTRRQWQGNTSTATVIGLLPRLAYGGGYSNEEKKRQRVSHLLQSGYRQQRFENSHRSRRQQPLRLESKTTGCKKGESFAWIGVEGVEIHERGGSGRFEQLCPGGVVYNLEVADNNNYFAEDILVHNCHHSTADSYRRVIDYYKQNPNLKVLGVTATPDRADEKALGQIFESVAYEYDILEGIEDGWLVPVNQEVVTVKDLDFSQVRTTAGDLNGKDLAEVMEYERNLHEVASATFQIAGDKKTLLFASSVAHADRLCEILNRHKGGSAQFVCGKTDKERRREIIGGFRDGQFQYLTNVGVATEGFDVPDIECIVMARPTKSRCLYTQMIGRGTRPLPGLVDGVGDVDLRKEAIAASNKPAVEVIDFIGNAGRHKLVHAPDVLGGKYDDAVVERAKKNIQSKRGSHNTLSELEKAERQLAAEARSAEAAAARNVLIARAHYSKAKVNPFDVYDIMPWREKAYNKGRQPTPKMLDMLNNCGVDTTGLSFTHASQMIKEIIKRRQQGRCTFKQAKLLKRFKYNPEKLTFEKASKIIDDLAKNKWRRKDWPRKVG